MSRAATQDAVQMSGRFPRRTEDQRARLLKVAQHTLTTAWLVSCAAIWKARYSISSWASSCADRAMPPRQEMTQTPVCANNQSSSRNLEREFASGATTSAMAGCAARFARRHPVPYVRLRAHKQPSCPIQAARILTASLGKRSQCCAHLKFFEVAMVVSMVARSYADRMTAESQQSDISWRKLLACYRRLA